MRGGGLYSAEECLVKAEECRAQAADFLQLAEDNKERWPLEARLRRVKWAAENEARASLTFRRHRERSTHKEEHTRFSADQPLGGFCD